MPRTYACGSFNFRGPPGKSAIKAVTQPAITDFLYFVADGKGGHWFAKSNEEHNKNVKKWREIEKKREITK